LNSSDLALDVREISVKIIAFRCVRWFLSASWFF